ncbi:MAG: hypothetical protein ACP5Q5_09210 [Brevinematia bacterium]
MDKSLMNKLNWIFVVSGILITYIGFYLTYFITTNYDGLYAFISVLTIVSGLILVILGLSINFKQKN